MSAWQHLAHAVVIGCLTAQAHFAMAQDDASIYGTHSVVFQPGQSSGILDSCTLLYRATQADYAYRNESPIMIVGSIGVRQFDVNMILTLKIGVRDIDVPSGPFTRPYFAYLQTPNATTAKSPHQIHDGDEGFRLIAVDLEVPDDLWDEIRDGVTWLMGQFFNFLFLLKQKHDGAKRKVSGANS